MKNLKKMKTLTREDLKKISGAIKAPWVDDGCGWPLCRNQFGRCSAFACDGVEQI